MPTYQLKSSTGAEYELAFTEEGWLEGFRSLNDVGTDRMASFMQTMVLATATHLPDLKTWAAHTHGMKLTEIAQDLSFMAFWSGYPVKQNKKRAERLWGQLTDMQRSKALTGLRRYKAYLQRNEGKLCKYPDTYLTNESWEDSFNA